MRVLQCTVDERLRVVVLGDGGEHGRMLPAVTEAAEDGLVPLIRLARTRGESLGRLLGEHADSAGDRVVVDCGNAVVRQGNQEFPVGVPITAPEIWAAGVSYVRSREAREAESRPHHSADFYSRVYEAERPELFLKDASCRRTVGLGADVAVRGDSRWTVPEPEIGLVLDAAGTIVGFTIGNDVSARDIEGENPLYLPQSKTYANSCALGPRARAGDRRWNAASRQSRGSRLILASSGLEPAV